MFSEKPADFTRGNIFFLHPEASKTKERIFPLFIPFAGCPGRCLFCSQEVQTGRKSRPVADVLQDADEDLAVLAIKGSLPAEVAFFGGTFSALPQSVLNQCFDFFARVRHRYGLQKARCSTRPDCIDGELLIRLKDAGFSTVELGIQSFSDDALGRVRRGYSREQALRACSLVKDAGLHLGVQLMPGLPDLNVTAAEEDIALAAKCGADFVRLYPCLVFEGTGLAQEWRAGRFVPWDDDLLYNFLVSACLFLWEQRIPVIRIGLAPERGLLDQLLAGTWHPSMGMRVRALALLRTFEKATRGEASFFQPQELAEKKSFSFADAVHTETRKTLFVPRRYAGEFWGHRGELVQAYERLGIRPAAVGYWNERFFQWRR